MATKIWEIDFTSFSGSSDVLYDQIGAQHLTIFSGTQSIQDPLTGFNNRKGVYISANGSVQKYVTYGPGTIDLTNARFTSSYTQRSFVLWVYPREMYNPTYWEGGIYDESFWCSNSAISTISNGVGANQPLTGIFLAINGTKVITTSALLSTAWHCIVITIDRGSNTTKFYIDKTLIGSSVANPTVATPYSEYLGDHYSAASEGSYYLGQATTYTGILTQSEINSIYDTFLVDSVVGSAYYQTFSGQVYGIDGVVASGVPIIAYYNDTNSIVHSTTTSGDGSYQVLLPYSGAYTVVAANGPYGGTAAIPVIATSGSVYFP